MTSIHKKISRLGTSVLLCFSALNATAAESDHPGSLDFSGVPFFSDREANIEVNLRGPVLKMLAKLPIQYDEGNEAAELLRVLEQVLVRVYTTDPEDSTEALAYIEQTSRSLENQEWMRIVKVREKEDSNVDIHVRMSEDGENLYGLVIMAVEEGREETEVVFVNISGNFNPAYLSDLGNQFDIDYLNDLDVEDIAED